MKKRLLSLLLCVLLVCSVLPITAMAAATTYSNYIDTSSLTLTHQTSSGKLSSITASFKLHSNFASATGQLVLMTKYLDGAGSPGSSGYGDISGDGSYCTDSSKNYSTMDALAAVTELGVIAYGGTNETYSSGTSSTLTLDLSSKTVSLATDKVYYVYLWTYGSSRYYPDALVCVIQVKDGALQFTAPTGRNSYDAEAFQNATFSDTTTYSVTVTPGANMTRKTDSGAASQTGLNKAMTPVVYTADSGYTFPADYTVAAVNGIMVRRDSETQITVYGTPSADATITLTAPSASSIPFTHAYDVQRSPAYPAQNTTITLSKLANPYGSDGRQLSGNTGSWTLTSVGKYSTIDNPKNYLTNLTNELANAYKEQQNDLTIHELKDGSAHIAFGVVVAYDAGKGRAIFLGDALNGGAGYLLSTAAVTETSPTMKAGTILPETITPTTPDTPDTPTDPDVPGDLAWLTPVLGALKSEPFDDVKVGDWFYDDVIFANEYDLMTGTAARIFAPDAPVTRGMVMTILARREGVKTDRYSPWYAAGVEWAVANGISDGTNPEAAITREELATMLYRYASLKGYDLSGAPLTGFGDANRVSGYAAPAVQWAVAKGLLTGAAGVDAGKLLPQQTATRAQLAAILHRFFG